MVVAAAMQAVEEEEEEEEEEEVGEEKKDRDEERDEALVETFVAASKRFITQSEVHSKLKKFDPAAGAKVSATTLSRWRRGGKYGAGERLAQKLVRRWVASLGPDGARTGGRVGSGKTVAVVAASSGGGGGSGGGGTATRSDMCAVLWAACVRVHLAILDTSAGEEEESEEEGGMASVKVASAEAIHGCGALMRMVMGTHEALDGPAHSAHLRKSPAAMGALADFVEFVRSRERRREDERWVIAKR
jgi:hypothetical protein